MIVKALTSHWNNARKRLLSKALRLITVKQCAHQ